MLNLNLKSLKDRYSLTDNTKYYLANGILFTLMSTFSRTYAVKFIYRLGGGDFDVSLFNALPGFVALLCTIPGIIWINRSINKKNTITKFFIWSRVLTLSFAIVPFFPFNFQPLIFVLLYGIMNFPESISVTALQSFTGDIFYPNERANAISIRNKFSTLAQLIAFLVLGKILGNRNLDEKSIIIWYQIFFILSFIIGICEIKTFYKLKEVQCSNIKINNFFSIIKDVFKNRNFRIFIICSSIFHFSWQMGWPLFSIYQIDKLGADENWLTIINFTSSIAMFFSYSYWNKIITKKGNSFSIAFATLGMALTPLLYAVSPNLFIINIMGLVTGFFTAGTTVTILNSLLEVSPEDHRIMYVGVHATCTSLTLAISPMISNIILSKTGIIWALVVTSVFRFIGSSAFLMRIKSRKNN